MAQGLPSQSGKLNKGWKLKKKKKKKRGRRLIGTEGEKILLQGSV